MQKVKFKQYNRPADIILPVDRYHNFPCLGLIDLYPKATFMPGKTNKQFFFEAQLNWLEGKRGILSAKDVSGTIHVATPPAFGGEGTPWTPEHLFLSSISSCYMTTFLSFAQKLELVIARFECDVVGQVEIVEGKYRFTGINLYPKIFIDDESMREKTIRAVEKTHACCLITNSVNATVFYHPQVLIDPFSITTDKKELKRTISGNSSVETMY